MSFLDAYKHLEQECGEVTHDGRKVTAYIEEMESIRDGAKMVKGWDDDLAKLKYYRRLRNELAHNPDASERKLVKGADIKWVRAFYKRLKKGKDPLSLYGKKTRRKGALWLLLILLAAVVAAVYFLFLR